MISSLNAIIRHHLGWCPHISSSRDRRVDTVPGYSDRTTAGFPGPEPAHNAPGSFHYRHTQIGSVQVWASVAAILIIALSVIFIGQYWFSYAAIIFLAAAILLFGSLTVLVDGQVLQVRFGPFGIVKRVVPRADIRHVRVVTTPWYYGWGIRWTPDGTLYNMAGTGGVEIHLADGTRFRIGTDEPVALADALARPA